MLLSKAWLVLAWVTGADGGYLVKPGDSLARIATEHYGNRAYQELIKTHNNRVDSRLPAGATLDVPPLDALLAAEQVTAAAPEEVALILGAHNSYRSLEGKLNAFPLADELRKELAKCADALTRAAAGFARRSAPRRISTQLRAGAEELRILATGDKTRSEDWSYAIDIVHQRLALALGYLVEWRRAPKQP